MAHQSFTMHLSWYLYSALLIYHGLRVGVALSLNTYIAKGRNLDCPLRSDLQKDLYRIWSTPLDNPDPAPESLRHRISASVKRIGYTRASCWLGPDPKPPPDYVWMQKEDGSYITWLPRIVYPDWRRDKHVIKNIRCPSRSYSFFPIR